MDDKLKIIKIYIDTQTGLDTITIRNVIKATSLFLNGNLSQIIVEKADGKMHFECIGFDFIGDD